MDDPGYFYLFMFLPSFLAALVAQTFVSAADRKTVIACAALGWTGLLALGLVLIGMISAFPDVFGLLAGGTLFLGFGLVPSLAGAILGSELSTLMRRLFRRPYRDREGIVEPPR